jgi:hypothetical protein
VAFLTKTPSTPARDVMAARNAARWFYWIAGLTVLNSVVAVMGTSFMMLFGMTSTLVATYIGINIGGSAVIVGVAISVLIGLAFAGFGWMAQRGAAWAFVTGIVLYTLDTAVTVYIHDWLAAVAHVFAIIIIAGGFLASQRLRKSGAAMGAQVLPDASAAGMVPGAAVPAAVPAALSPGMAPAGGAGQAPPAPLTSGPTGFAEATAPPPLD